MIGRDYVPTKYCQLFYDTRRLLGLALIVFENIKKRLFIYDFTENKSNLHFRLSIYYNSSTNMI